MGTSAWGESRELKCFAVGGAVSSQATDRQTDGTDGVIARANIWFVPARGDRWQFGLDYYDSPPPLNL